MNTNQHTPHSGRGHLSRTAGEQTHRWTRQPYTRHPHPPQAQLQLLMALLWVLWALMRQAAHLLWSGRLKRKSSLPRPSMRVLPLLLLSMVAGPAGAQQGGAKAAIAILRIGDALPPTFWDTPLSMLQGGEGPWQGSLRDYADSELLVLDFWHTSCGSCISSMRHAEALQDQWKGRLQVLAVTVQDAATVLTFAGKNALLRNTSLPLVVNDDVLKRYFPYRTMPHLVFIRHNRVLHIGGSEAMDEATIEALLNDKPLNLDFYKDDFAERRPLLPASAIAAEGNCYYSLLTGYRRDAAAVVGQLADTLAYSKRVYRYNQSLLQLICYALDVEPPPRNRIVFKDTDLQLATTAYHRQMGNRLQWLVKHGYCYEAQLPLDVPQAAIRRSLAIDMEQMLGIRASMTAHEIPVLRLAASAKPIKGTPAGSFSLRYLLDAYNRLPTALPLLDPDNLAEQCWVERQSLADCTAEELLAAICKAGLQLREERATLPVLMIEGRAHAHR